MRDDVAPPVEFVCHCRQSIFDHLLVIQHYTRLPDELCWYPHRGDVLIVCRPPAEPVIVPFLMERRTVIKRAVRSQDESEQDTQSCLTEKHSLVSPTHLWSSFDFFHPGEGHKTIMACNATTNTRFIITQQKGLTIVLVIDL